ncbi:hypothetical protein P4O66_018462, partial [Electrophorus voltai]
SKRHALQDYKKTDGVRLVAPPDSSCMTKSKKMSLGKCARRCSRNRKLPFTCRAFSFDQNGTKCHLLSFDSFIVGVHVENDFNFDLYEKKVFYLGDTNRRTFEGTCAGTQTTAPQDLGALRRTQTYATKTATFLSAQKPYSPSTVECMKCNGESYRGPMDHTESGRECQRWDLDEPHKHLFHPKRYPDKGLKDNYCRNPDGRQRPWCFTTDAHTAWEYCDIKQCASDNNSDVETSTACFRGNGEGYRGTVEVIHKGLKCQRWDAQFPHPHPYTPQNYHCKDMRENYCRNPDGRHAPWCFTTDPSIPWAFCTDIPRCGSAAAGPEECYMGNGETYRGKQVKTRSGIPCALWNDHFERGEHVAVTLSDELEGNFCRNPDKDKHGPWCYTNSSLIPWDYCTIKLCEFVYIYCWPAQHCLKDMVSSYKIIYHREICILLAFVFPDEVSDISCFVHKQVRIVGGGPIPIKDGSWMVSIQKGATHWCGGSLVREEWVLTDRECFSSCVPDLSEYRVWLGSAHLNESAENNWSRQERRIAHVVCGPEGSGLALLQLAQPALITEQVRIIQLPVADCSIQEGIVCSTYGWGETKDTGHEGKLKSVQLPIVSNERCHQLHRGSLQITNAKVCAGGKRDEGVCEKDYGGPLVCQEKGSKVIVGVSIHGRGCARHNRPGIFVNVAHYTGWIHKVFKTYPYSDFNY